MTLNDRDGCRPYRRCRIWTCAAAKRQTLTCSNCWLSYRAHSLPSRQVKAS